MLLAAAVRNLRYSHVRRFISAAKDVTVRHGGGVPRLRSGQNLHSLGEEGFELMLACPQGEWDLNSLQIHAVPSYDANSLASFRLAFAEQTEIDEEALPPQFEDVSETRFLISSTLRASLFGGTFGLYPRTRKEMGKIRISPVSGRSVQILFGMRTRA